MSTSKGRKFSENDRAVHELCMKQAINAFKANGYARASQIARQYGVSRTTMLSRVAVERHTVARMGAPTALPIEAEKHLADHVAYLSEIGFPRTKAQVIAMAKELVRALEDDEERRESFTAPDDWYDGFLKRHPFLSAVKPQRISASRHPKFAREIVYAWYDTFGDLIKLYEPQEIFNCDYASFNYDESSPRKVVISKVTRANNVRAAPKGDQQTLTACGDATGKMLPLFWTFAGAGKFKRENMLEGAPGSTYTVTPNGWPTSDTWAAFAVFFGEWVKRCKLSRALLIVVGAATQDSLKAMEIFRENNVYVLALPPGCAHKMQPLDRAFFKRLRDHVQAVIDEQFLHTRPDESSVAGIFAKAYARMVPVPGSSKPHPLQSGFRSTGLVPFNPRPFGDADFAASDAFRARTGAESPAVRVRGHDPKEIAAACAKGFDATSAVSRQLAEHNKAGLVDPSDLLYTDDRVAALLARDEAAETQHRKAAIVAEREADAAEKSARQAEKVAEKTTRKAPLEAEKEARAKRLTDVAAKEAHEAPRSAARMVAPQPKKRARGPAHPLPPPPVVDLEELRELEDTTKLEPPACGRKRRAPLRLLD